MVECVFDGPPRQAYPLWCFNTTVSPAPASAATDGVTTVSVVAECVTHVLDWV